MPAGSIPWLFGLGLAIGAFGFALALWRLVGDRWRHRRIPVPRRCPKCVYSMASVEGLRCPECGHESASESSLHRARVRWISALVFLLLLTPLGVGLAAHRPLFDLEWERRVPERLLLWVTPADLTFEHVSGRDAQGNYVSGDVYHGSSTELGKRVTDELLRRWEHETLTLRTKRGLLARLLQSRDPVGLRFVQASDTRGPVLVIDTPGYTQLGARLTGWKPAFIRAQTVRVRPSISGAGEFAATLTANAYALDLPAGSAPPFDCTVIVEDRGVELWRGTMTVSDKP